MAGSTKDLILGTDDNGNKKKAGTGSAAEPPRTVVKGGAGGSLGQAAEPPGTGAGGGTGGSLGPAAEPPETVVEGWRRARGGLGDGLGAMGPVAEPQGTGVKGRGADQTRAGSTALPVGGGTGGGDGYWQDLRDKTAREKIDYLLNERKAVDGKLDEEAQKREEKRLKREGLFAAIGDGLSALSNMYFASRGAQPMRRLNLSEGVRERWDRMMKERENERDRGFSLLDAQHRIASDMADVLGRQKQEQQRYEFETRKQEREAKKAEAYNLRLLAATEKDNATAEWYMKRAEIQEKLAEGQMSKIEADNELKKAQAAYYNRKPGSSAGRGGATKKYPVFNKDGEVVGHVYTKDEAMAETYKNGGTYPHYETERVTHKDITGQNTRSVTKKTYQGGGSKQKQKGKGGNAGYGSNTKALGL